jgi:hypothetical protein
VSAFGLDLGPDLAAQPLLLADPALARARAGVLAYFEARGREVAPGRLVFRFGASDLVSEGDAALVRQVRPCVGWRCGGLSWCRVEAARARRC